MKTFGILGVVAWLACAGCGGSTNDSSAASETTPPASPGSSPTDAEFSGAYEVPVPAELAAAATYPTAGIHWAVQNATAHLEYDLPPGLVGSAVHVEFSGPFDVSTGKGTLSGGVGTAECTVTATAVSCLERMPGILPITPDMALIEAIAKQEYVGPAQDRLDVTQRFIGDPIGIVRFDSTAGAVDDHHKGDDGAEAKGQDD